MIIIRSEHGEKSEQERQKAKVFHFRSPHPFYRWGATECNRPAVWQPYHG